MNDLFSADLEVHHQLNLLKKVRKIFHKFQHFNKGVISLEEKFGEEGKEGRTIEALLDRLKQKKNYIFCSHLSSTVKHDHSNSYSDALAFMYDL